MSSPSSSPRLSIHSPPFTPIRSSTRKGITLASPPDASPALLLTPGATPLTGKTTNRFGVLASPSATRNTTRIPLKAKSQNVVEPGVGADANWRVNRKRESPKTPVRANGNDLLPTPFHSTQRRSKVSQNQNINPTAVTPLRTPFKTKKATLPPTPGDSPFTLLTNKIAPLSLSTPPKLPASFALAPVSPVSPTKKLPELPSVEPKITAHCAACSRILSSAALLSPCNHLVCSPCLTGCLNAAGEKPMDCMACKMPISTFQLTSVVVSATGSTLPVAPQVAASVAAATQQAQTLTIAPPLPVTITPVQPINILGVSTDVEEPCVLRIDNVPWDVTPQMLAEWLGDTPAVHNYALIDRRDGRTLSYAYMEVTAEAMKAILRSRQNTILGSGKRARAVTITVSTQEELMREIFPNWKGHFLGSRPCVAGMDNVQISCALRDGLLSQKEAEDILKLLRKPNSHFVKVPTLPYYHLIALLRKFPMDKDSKVLHTPTIKQTLYSLAQVAAEELRARLDDDAFASSPIEPLKAAVLCCQAFSQSQRAELTALLQDDNGDVLNIHALAETGRAESEARSLDLAAAPELFDILATTHNISPKVVQALAADLLKRLTSTGNQDTAMLRESLESSCVELPMAFCSSSSRL